MDAPEAVPREKAVAASRAAPHLLEDGQAVVGAAAVAAEAHSHAGPEQLRQPCDAVAEEHVAARAVGDGGAALAHEADLSVIEPYAVHGHRARPEHTEAVEMAHGRGAVLAQCPLALVAALRHVDVKDGVLRLGHLEARPQHGR